MMTMTLDMTSKLAPLVWMMNAALLVSAAALVGLSLPDRWEARFGRLGLAAAAGCGLACVAAALIAR